MPLNLDAMNQAAGQFIGRHDFAALRAIGCSALTTVRHVRRVDVSAHSGDPRLLAINVEGDAFLRNMVRILVGTLLSVGEGQLRPDRIPGILASRDRAQAGPTAPAHGLTLLSVSYEGRRAPLEIVPRA
jgi:tRNA pseudouridine38-40 synthase